jgi:hypothetical protein
MRNYFLGVSQEDSGMSAGDLWATFQEGVGYKRFAISGVVAIAITVFFFIAQRFGIASLLAIPHWAVGSVAALALLLFWVLQYANQLRQELKPNIELSFDPARGCVVVTPVLLGLADGNQRESEATSVRVLVQAATKVAPKNATAFLTKFEKQSVGGGAWEPRQHHELVQLTWTSNTFETDLSDAFPKSVNVIHIGAHNNQITVWGAAMPLSLRDFFNTITTYRFTVSVIADGRTSTTRLEVDWRGQWDTIVVRPA